MTLYEMTSQMMQIYETLTNAELDEAEIAEIMADNMQAIGADDKLDSYAKILRQFESDLIAVKSEIDRLSAQKKRIEKATDTMKEAIATFMTASGIDKEQTELFKFSFRKSESVSIDDEEALPKAFCNEVVTYKPDKALIKVAIKNGETVPGASIVTERKVQIK